MAERLDPEALAGVLARYFAVARSAVERHGGSVEKFIGDAVVAMFGVERVREDDALRAVRTGLDLREAVDRLNEELGPAFGVRLRLRTGINTGEVLVDDTRTDSLAVGHAVSMAARLEQAAGADEVVVGEPTYRLLGDGVDATELQPLAVKGSSLPLRAWRIAGLPDVAGRGWQATGAYLGRDEELARVATRYRRVIADASSDSVLVVAPPGLGKSRFAAEVAARLDPAPRTIIGRGIADGGSTYEPVVGVLRELGAANAGDEFETSMRDLPDASRVARAARALVTGTGVATSAEVAWIVRRVATAIAASGPVLLVLDDLHWMDPLLLDVIAGLVEPSLPARVLIMGLTRPELIEERPDWIARMPSTTVIRLPPLSQDDTERLVEERLGEDVDPAHRDRVIQAAAGVPLFVEQLAALDAEEARDTVPTTIRALMAARIDRVGGTARTLLETAAIAGEAFTDADVDAAATVDADMDALIRREILRPDTSPHGYRFSHALLRDAVIDAIPRRRRADLHERRAAVLEASNDHDLERIGFHLESAWRERTAIALPDDAARSVAARASQALATVGRRSLARKEWHRAAGLLTRADVLAAGDPVRSEVLPDLIDALVHARRLDDADERHDEAIRIARGPLDRARADAAWGRSVYVRRSEDWPERTREIADAAIAVFQAAGDETWLARAHILRFYSTEADSELDELKAARLHAERSGDERSLIEVWDELGGSMLFGPTPYPEVLEFMRAEVAWARERGVAFTEADGLLGEAMAWVGLGDLDAAQARIDVVRGLFEALPSVVEQLGEALMLEATIDRYRDKLDASADALRRSVEVFLSCGESGWARSARLTLAHAELDLGYTDAAVELLDIARRGRTSMGWFSAQLLAGDARVALQRGDHQRARDLAHAGSRAITRETTHRNSIRALELLGDVLAAIGFADDARPLYEDARARAEAKEDRVIEPRLRGKLADLR